MMEELYKERIISLYKSQKNRGVLSSYSHKLEGKNPTCGDMVTIYIEVDQDDTILNIKFDGVGCAVSIAAIQLLIDELVGKHVQEIMRITDENVIAMLGVEISHAREKCATLGIRTIRTIV